MDCRRATVWRRVTGCRRIRGCRRVTGWRRSTEGTFVLLKPALPFGDRRRSLLCSRECQRSLLWSDGGRRLDDCLLLRHDSPRGSVRSGLLSPLLGSDRRWHSPLSLSGCVRTRNLSPLRTPPVTGTVHRISLIGMGHRTRSRYNGGRSRLSSCWRAPNVGSSLVETRVDCDGWYPRLVADERG